MSQQALSPTYIPGAEVSSWLAKERTVVASISAGDRDANEVLERERTSRLAAERTLREVREQLQQARSTGQSSERALENVRAELTHLIRAAGIAGGCGCCRGAEQIGIRRQAGHLSLILVRHQCRPSRFVRSR